MPKPLPIVSTRMLYRSKSKEPQELLTSEEIDEWLAEESLTVLNISSPQPPEVWKELDERLFAKRPEVFLRAHAKCGTDVSFLASMPHVRRIAIATPYEEPAKHLEDICAMPQWEAIFVRDNSLKDLSFLEKAPEGLTHLQIGSDWIPHRDLDASVIQRFQDLRYLSVGGCRHGLMSALSTLSKLRSLNLNSSIQLKPAVMQGMTSLEALCLSGLTAKNLSFLSDLNQLRMLDLNGIKSLSDLSFISGLTRLQYLHLIYLDSLKVLPDLSTLTALDTAGLEYLKKLEDTTGFANAPALQTVRMEGMERLKPEVFEPILTCPALKRVYGYFKTKPANKKFEAMCKRHGVTNDFELGYESHSGLNHEMRFVWIAHQSLECD